MKRKLPFKKRQLILIAIAVYASVLLVHYLINRHVEKPRSVGTLVLPGAAEQSHEFTMPLTGALQIFLQPITDNSVEIIPGTTFDKSVCSHTDPATRKLPGYVNSVRKCVRFGQYGVVKFELINTNDDKLIQTRYSPIMYRLPSKLGTAVADFRRFEKGTTLQVNVTSYLSESLKERERIPYNLIFKPRRTPKQQ